MEVEASDSMSGYAQDRDGRGSELPKGIGVKDFDLQA
jgi:hypothetical protein